MKKIFIKDSLFNDGNTCTASYSILIKRFDAANYQSLPIQYQSPVVIDNLEEDTPYNVKITRTCCGGVASSEITLNFTTTEVDAPTLSASPGDDLVDLNWDDISGADGYSLERGLEADYSDAVEIYNGVPSMYSDTGLTGGTTYYYRVRAYQTGFLASAYSNDSATPS